MISIPESRVICKLYIQPSSLQHLILLSLKKVISMLTVYKPLPQLALGILALP